MRYRLSGPTVQGWFEVEETESVQKITLTTYVRKDDPHVSAEEWKARLFDELHKCNTGLLADEPSLSDIFKQERGS